MQTLEHAPLSKYCTFGIGGSARYLIRWEKISEIDKIVKFAADKKLPIFFFGSGSNLLFPDDGLEAVVVRCMTRQIELSGQTLICGAGAMWPMIGSYCKNNDLFGLDGLYGLPGTVGGAIAGNAGCHGQEIKDLATKIEYYDMEKKEFVEYEVDREDFDYRWSFFKDHPNWIITKAYFEVSKDEKDRFGDQDTYKTFRKEKQPQGLTTGSFFKNPYPDHAGALLEKSGFKGYKHGNVGFSDKHANFMLNHGGGTANEVMELAHLAQNKVQEDHGIRLEPEVHLVSVQDLMQ